MRSFIKKVNIARRRIFGRIFGITSSPLLVGSKDSSIRILFVANAYIPTLQLSFIKPLAPLVSSGELAIDVLTEEQMKELFGKKKLQHPDVLEWVDKRFSDFKPTAVIFCRYSGPNVEHIIQQAQKSDIPTIFHVDDDLLNVPLEIGKKKYEFHNHPSRLATVKFLLEHSDLVYCSTQALKRRFESYGYENRFYAGKIYCSGEVLVPAVHREVRKIGYMGFDHAHDFELMSTTLPRLLRQYSHIKFELFGSIPKPEFLNEFGSRVTVIPPVRNYEDFIKRFTELEWDIGICPLASTPFNEVKANTKWVEYTSVGAAVIATKEMIYDDCCSDGGGVLVKTDDDWYSALEALVCNSEYRYRLVLNAQQKLKWEYSVVNLREQVLEVLRLVSGINNESNIPESQAIARA